MFSNHDFRVRADEPEIMDDCSIGGAMLTITLAQIRWINRLFGASRLTIEGVARLWRWAGSPNTLSLLDVGAGSGDQSRMLLRWAEQHHVDMTITLMDIHPETCAVAVAYHRGEPRIRVEQGDVLTLAPGRADIVTASLFLHHFSSEQVPEVLRVMLGASRLGIVINDLHRHVIPWAFIWLATRLLTRNPMIQFDAPLSVRRGFRAEDFRRLQQYPDFQWLRYAWRPLFRYLVIVPQTARLREE